MTGLPRTGEHPILRLRLLDGSMVEVSLDHGCVSMPRVGEIIELGAFEGGINRFQNEFVVRKVRWCFDALEKESVSVEHGGFYRWTTGDGCLVVECDERVELTGD